MRIRHWQDVARLLLGVWLVLSPFALGFAGAAVWITVVLGLSVILLAVEGFFIPSYLEEWERSSSVWLWWWYLGRSATSRYRPR
jgi:hypothetical protein